MKDKAPPLLELAEQGSNKLPAVVKPPEPEVKDFDWSDTGCIIVREQLETAAYWNPSGDLIIQQRSWPDEDHLIVIAGGHVDRFIDKLTDLIGIPSFGKP